MNIRDKMIIQKLNYGCLVIGKNNYLCCGVMIRLEIFFFSFIYLKL